MPTPETALLYTGTCLFEGTNLNEGRGTDTPFQVFGAPWLDSVALIDRIQKDHRAGLKLDPLYYRPKSIPGKAANPRYMDQRCQGVRITVTDPDRARPFSLAIAVLCAAYAQHPNQIELTDFLDTLLGTPIIRRAIRSGQNATAILAGFSSELRLFNAERPKRYRVS
jgi:uncharacterized protein YbbC (DUF1343 family)